MFSFRRLPNNFSKALRIARVQKASNFQQINCEKVSSDLDGSNRLTCQRVPEQTTGHAYLNRRYFCSTITELTEAEYEELAEETLDSLSEMFEDLQENFECAPEYDVTFSSGVLSVSVSNSWGTIVINKQTPNKQIWLSSPISGPKRFDYVDGIWVYKHDGSVLHQLLSKEVSEALGGEIDFTQCTYGKR